MAFSFIQAIANLILLLLYIQSKSRLHQHHIQRHINYTSFCKIYLLDILVNIIAYDRNRNTLRLN